MPETPAPGGSTRLVVKVTAGADAPERCAQAFTVASIAVASGAEVELWLTGESTWFALPGRAAEFTLAESAPLEDLLAAVLESGRVYLCRQCAARRGIVPSDLLPGVEIAGAAAFVASTLRPATQALVY